MVFHERLISRRLFLDQVFCVQSRLVVDPPEQPQGFAYILILAGNEVQQIILRRIAVEEDGAGHAVGQRSLLRDPCQIIAHPGRLHRPRFAGKKADKIIPQSFPHRFVQHSAASHGRFRDLAGSQQIFAGALQLILRALFLLRSFGVFLFFLPRLLRVRLQADIFFQQTFRLFVLFAQIFIHASILLYLLRASPAGCKIN